MQVDGNCHCGAIAFTGEIDPADVRVCHCLDCQQLSGTAFRVNVPCPADKFRLVRGEPKTYIKTAESGARRVMAFCGVCSAELYSCAAEAPPSYMLRTGVLNQRSNLSPAKQIWLGSATPWARDLLDVPGFEAQPPA